MEEEWTESKESLVLVVDGPVFFKKNLLRDFRALHASADKNTLKAVTLDQRHKLIHSITCRNMW